ncbi:hypothetical protein BU24DRAFT_420566 [Aaosphaeria arxii CBS 175.79]|uniref:Uncharacterized protein n=1 Tax=Aaosphaeria arxii CBS 175.79 TaxID=1450172 RepID=A0A6A5XW42_9PLEO|nr:uncharacterized protein BU24DRAFT_420566 [Aaosphaeria arxii CBS 175.79]KAF2017538.1 hypothetical protein BU24DRAFT_420566 [Aaosphaeria arxii CBS 175.79]
MFSWTGCFKSSAAWEPAPIRPIPLVPPSISSRPISDWHIDRHDREALAATIIPCMTLPLEDKHNLQSITKKHPWIKEFIQSETATAQDNHIDEFRNTKAAFCEKPSRVSADLLKIARILFYILVRYTYLTRFEIAENGREASQAVLELDDLATDRHDTCYFSGLDPDDADRLIHRKRYGAGFYRARYRDTIRCMPWETFCINVRKFCQSLELNPSTDDPEVNIKDIQQNLTSILLHRKIQSDISSNSERIRAMGRELEKLDEQSRDEMKKNIGEINRQLEETQTRFDSDLSRRETDMALGFEESRATLRNRLDTIASSVTRIEGNSKQLEHKMQNEVAESRATFGSRLDTVSSSITRIEGNSKQLEHKLQNELADVRKSLDDMRIMHVQYAKAHKVDLCRWLMENLPYITRNGPKNANERWRLFWSVNWNACRRKQLKKHPLWALIHDQKYDKVGKDLFTTMNGKIHGYGTDIGNPLSVEVQKVIDAIMPADYMSKAPNINSEKKRWKI